MQHKVEKARSIDGVAAPFFLAYYVSHRWGGALEDSREHHEHLIDADVDAEVLRKRINAHHALPMIVKFNRGNKHEIPPFAMSSKPMFGSGGGCNYNAHIDIRPAPILKVTVCPACDGGGRVPNPDPAMAGNNYFNVDCPQCGRSGLV